MRAPPIAEPHDRLPSLTEALLVWARIGCLSFGGPAGQIALLHQEIVERRRWLGDRRFLHGLGFCALLPGPEAQQLATYLGWVMHGPLGGVAAGTLFVLPGAAVLLALSTLFVTLGAVPAVAGLFFGLKCAVLGLVLQALLRIGGRALKTRLSWLVALAGFTAVWAFAVPFPAVVLAAGLLGALQPARFAAAAHGPQAASDSGLIERLLLADPTLMAHRLRAARRAGLAALAAWLVPVAALVLWAPGRFAQIAVFFSRVAVVTLGGAYAVLAYVAQQAVHTQHWLTAPDMLAGLGLAETTPGPLLLVLQFVGFLAGYHAPGVVTGLTGGIAASALVLWVTFMPCFAFVFLGAPLIEALAENRRLAAALAAITAAVVGVIGNLAVWFSLHVLFRASIALAAGPASIELPVMHSLDMRAAGLAAAGAVLLFGLRQSVPRTLGLCAALGVVISLV